MNGTRRRLLWITTVLFALFGGILWRVVANYGAPGRVDVVTARFVLDHRGAVLTRLMETASRAGSSVVIVPVLFLASGWSFPPAIRSSRWLSRAWW